MVISKTIGVEDNLRAFNAYRREIGRGVERAVRKANEYLLKETLPVTPKDKGILRDSGKVNINGRGVNTTGFVSFSAPYAVYVHEDLSKYHAPGTYAKFLERTARAKKLQMREIMRSEIQQACKNTLGKIRAGIIQ